MDVNVNSSISEDRTRDEEPWTLKGETLILKWNNDIKISKKMHEESGYYYKNMRKRWGLPAIVLPAVMAPFSAVFSDSFWIKYVNASSFMIVAFMSGIDSFFSFATRKERHFNHSARYAELATSIESELLKNKRFRIQSDVFTTQIRMRYDMLNTIAPIIPLTILKKYKNKEDNTVDDNNDEKIEISSDKTFNV